MSSSDAENLIVGAGFSGAVLAQKIAEELDEKVLLIDKKDHLAGNSYDYKDKNGIHIHKYGSHIFHTNNENVWKYLRRFASFNTYMHRVVGVIDGIETFIPFNLSTLHEVFPPSLAANLEEKLLANYSYNTKIPICEFQKCEDSDLKFLAQYIYEKIFKNYTEKQWGKDFLTAGSSAVTARVPVVISNDSRYFQDKFQGIPLEGYTKLVKNMVDHPNIRIKLNTDYKDIEDTSKFKRIFYTGSIDEFFNYKFGMLPFRSVNFEFEEFDREYYQCNSVVNYPNEYDFTRIHEYKYYLEDESSKTVIAKEYSEPFELGKNERYYPIPNDENAQLYKKYSDAAKELKNVYFLGRLGDYKYYNMDQAVERALNMFEEICQKLV